MEKRGLIDRVRRNVADLLRPDDAAAEAERLALMAPLEPAEGRFQAPSFAEGARAGPDSLADLRFAYRPMWDSRHSVISAYLRVAVVPAGEGGIGFNDADLAFADAPEHRVHLDFALQQQVMEELRRMTRENRRLLLALSVHFDTLAPSARRRRYLQELQAGLSEEARKLLVIEVAGVPPGVPQPRLLEIGTALRQHCRAVAARVHLQSDDFSHFQGTGIGAVGCDIAGSPSPEVIIMQQMSRFNRAAEKVGLVTYLRGVRSLSLVAAALGAGYRFIDGDAVVGLIAQPKRIVGFGLLDVYALLLRA
jgi:hypothetical protein